MNIVVVLLVISAVVNVSLIYASYVTVKKIEIYEDNIMRFYEGATKILRTSRHLDNREMFEKDDEVGTLYESVNELINDFRQKVNEEEWLKLKKKNPAQKKKK